MLLASGQACAVKGPWVMDDPVPLFPLPYLGYPPDRCGQLAMEVHGVIIQMGVYTDFPAYTELFCNLARFQSRLPS